MRRFQPRHLSASLALIAVSAACYGAGCGPDFQSCEQRLDCGTGGSGTGGDGTGASGAGANVGPGGGGGNGGSGGGEQEDCTPEDGGSVPESCGFFVKAGGSGAGSKAAPFGNLQAALDAAATSTTKKTLFVCAEEFVGNIVVPSGVTIVGGFEKCADEWLFAETKRSTIRSNDGPHTVELSPGSETTTLTNLEIIAEASETPGHSPVAVFANGTKVVLQNCRIVAEDGSPGGDGSPLSNSFKEEQAPGGAAGASCGGALVASPIINPECIEAKGGVGGASSFPTKGGDGAPAYANAPTAGVGGNNETESFQCGDGTKGASGERGGVGTAATTSGLITALGFQPPVSGDGGTGKPGQGGGGGGASLPKGTCTAGAQGGLGAAGGCGGGGGGAGQAGGSSIGLLSRNATVTISGGAIQVGRGGDGGKGVEGRDGQPGGLGGTTHAPGGTGSGGAANACAGGAGGNGGKGGPGAGGRGGDAIAIAFVGTEPSVEGSAPEISLPSETGIGGVGAADGTDADDAPGGIIKDRQALPSE